MTTIPAFFVLPLLPHWPVPFNFRIRFPPSLDGKFEQSIHPVTEPECAPKYKTVQTIFWVLGPNRVCPHPQLTLMTCVRPNLFPARLIRTMVDAAPRTSGGQGRTLIPWLETPSLNPGLWSNLYPPIVSRRQAKKKPSRGACPLGPEGQASPVPLLYVRRFQRSGCSTNQLARVLK